MKTYKDIKSQFEKYVNKTITCWFWTGYKDKDGYGILRRNYINYKTHRLSYQLYKGLIPPKKIIMHSCDNPSCVNPEHLSIGTFRKNTQDMISKNRQAKGENIKNSKLTEKQVLEIRSKYIPYKYLMSDLAKEYNVTRQTILHIIYRKTWKHI